MQLLESRSPYTSRCSRAFAIHLNWPLLFLPVACPIRCLCWGPWLLLFTGILGPTPLEHSNFPPSTLFMGGGIGAFIVLLSGILLFTKPKMRGETLGLALVCSLGGGILGLLGAELAPVDAQHRAAHIGSAVFEVWQSGVALMLSLLLNWNQKRS